MADPTKYSSFVFLLVGTQCSMMVIQLYHLPNDLFFDLTNFVPDFAFYILSAQFKALLYTSDENDTIRKYIDAFL